MTSAVSKGFFTCRRCGTKTDVTTGGMCSECWVRLNPPMSPIVQQVVACKGCGEENVRLLREVVEYRAALHELRDAVMGQTGDDTVEESIRIMCALRRAERLIGLPTDVPSTDGGPK